MALSEYRSDEIIGGALFLCAADSRFLPSALSHLPVALRVLEFLHLFVWHRPERIYDEEHDEQGDYHR